MPANGGTPDQHDEASVTPPEWPRTTTTRTRAARYSSTC
jgi:hypothetical protein